jgi:serine/threonine protein kinase
MYRWRSLIASGFESDFRLILRFNSGLKSVDNYRLDLRSFCETSSGIYQRITDGVFVFVKRFVIKAKRPLYTIEIENLLNLNHPCICGPFGFGIPEGRELFMIGRLYVPGMSLSEVLSTCPDWWTANTKAITIAGIALGLRFMHSFGLLHGNLKPQNVLFNESHRIEICDLSVERVSSDNANDAMGFGGDKWSPKVDIVAFASILYLVIVGSPIPEQASLRAEALQAPKVRAFVPSFIEEALSQSSQSKLSFFGIFRTLKQNRFHIVDGVDSDEVFDFVRSIRSFEKSRD